MNNHELEHIDSEKDLGIIIDSGLTFEEHISQKVTKENAILRLIRRSFSCLDRKSFLKL